MIIFLIIVALIIVITTVVVYLFMQQPAFGKAPQAKRLAQYSGLPNFKNGIFQNIHDTPQLATGYSMPLVLFNYIFNKEKHRKPLTAVPSIRTDLHNLPATDDVLIWFGHSSYFIQINGKKFLIDPVFSGNASPLAGSNKAFNGSNIYSAADMPVIDYLLITHDHYDHLDYKTVIQLQQKARKVICGLGVGEHFERWGYNEKNIIEKNWNEEITLENNITIFTTPARHFSGRGFKRNTSLWLSFLLQVNDYKIFIGGDSGYDTHFAEIGKTHGPIDLAILENGQYNAAWRYIHTLPDEFLQAADDLQAKKVLPVHNSKFAMANHAWNAPMAVIASLNKKQGFLQTPVIGQPFYLKKDDQQFTHWWQAEV